MSETITQKNLYHQIWNAFDCSHFSSANSSREEGIREFKKLGLPGPRAEEYRFTPITRALEQAFNEDDFTAKVESSFASVDQYLIPGYECNLVVLINGRYSEKFSKIISPAEQISIRPLSLAASENNADFDAYFTKLSATSNDAFAALNTAFWSDGVFINVPANTVVEKPVFILHLQDASAANVVSQTRLLAIIGEGSELSLAEKNNSIGTRAVFNCCVEEIEVKDSAVLNYHKIQNDGGSVFQVSNTRIHQHNSSRVNTFTLTLDGHLIRNNLSIIIDGENCESHFYGLYLLQGKTLGDNHTVVDHLKPNSYSNELYKGIMDGYSKGVFNGKIYVRPHAQKTNAFQSNRNILLSETSSVNTKPQLEIWADDVKCSHGCTSGQLDEEALFYLQSRGISRDTARAMVLYAFAGEVFAATKSMVLKGYLDNLISERLQKIG